MSRTRIGEPRVARRDDDLLEVLERAGVAAAAHHVLGAAELDEPRPGLDVAAAHRLGDALDRDAVRAQPHRVDVHLVLLLVAADGGDLGHAGDGLEVVAQVPVLQRAQFGEAALAGLVDERVLEDPAEAERVGAELGLDSGRERREDA